MSFDLYFKSTTKNFTEEMFYHYFSQRQHYIINEKQAWYENPNTGVYFCFEFNDEYADEEGEDYHALFNMNYFRPHYFALEAEKEVSFFLESFDFQIEDPQIDGMGNEYSEEGFLNSWDRGNESAYSSVLPQVNLNDYYFVPSDLLVLTWAYNYYLSLLQEKISHLSNAYVPPIQFGLIHGKLQRYTYWPNLTPIAIHTMVDVIVLCKSNDQNAEGNELEWEFYPVELNEFKPFLDKYASFEEQMKFYILEDKNISEEIISLFDSQKPCPEEDFIPLTHDIVLDIDIARKYMNFK
jgi:hypothetical protein